MIRKKENKMNTGKKGWSMNNQDIAVYRSIQGKTDKAMKTLDTLSDKVYDEKLALQISGQALMYSELHNMASRQLLSAKEQGYRPNVLSDFLNRSSLHYNTLLNASTGHIAELLIENSNHDIVEMEKALHHYNNVGEDCAMLAKQFIGLEEESIRKLKDYL